MKVCLCAFLCWCMPPLTVEMFDEHSTQGVSGLVRYTLVGGGDARSSCVHDV
jgi:hypothetical protein